MTRIGVEPSDLVTAAGRLDAVAQALLTLRGQVLSAGFPDTGRPDSRSALALTTERLVGDLAISVRVTMAHADDLRAAAVTYGTVESGAVRVQ